MGQRHRLRRFLSSERSVNSVSVETILVVEDNQALREGLVLNFRNRGYGVDSAEDGREGMHKAMATRPDLIVLDVMLPGQSGLDILTELRRKGRKVPVLILSARGRTEDKVEGLSSGADDYLAKPFELPELMARVEVMLRRRRADPARDKRLTFGPVAIHRERREVFVEGREIELSVKEFGVLDFLAEAPGRPRTRARSGLGVGLRRIGEDRRQLHRLPQTEARTRSGPAASYRHRSGDGLQIGLRRFELSGTATRWLRDR